MFPDPHIWPLCCQVSHLLFSFLPVSVSRDTAMVVGCIIPDTDIIHYTYSQFPKRPLKTTNSPFLENCNEHRLALGKHLTACWNWLAKVSGIHGQSCLAPTDRYRDRNFLKPAQCQVNDSSVRCQLTTLQESLEAKQLVCELEEVCPEAIKTTKSNLRSWERETQRLQTVPRFYLEDKGIS